MGWLAFGLIVASVIVGKSQGKRTGGLMFLSGLAGLVLAFWIAGWWGSGPAAERVAPGPTPTQVVQVEPGGAPTSDQVSDQVLPAGPVG